MQVNPFFAQPMVYKEVVEHADDGIGGSPSPRQQLHQFWGMDLQHTPNIAHFQGVQKYIGPAEGDRWDTTPAVPCQNCSGQ